MATVTQSPADSGQHGDRLVLHDVGWNDYEAMLEIVGERHIRVTYDRGTMEVVMPSQRHERVVQLIGLFVPRLAELLEVPYEPLGMTTWRKPDVEKGLEADLCYYLRNQAIVRDRELLDLEVDPPSDLAIEVDITSSSLNRMEIYAGLGVPEVWRYDGRTMTFFELGADQRYYEREERLGFPGLRSADVLRFVEMGSRMDKLRWAGELRDWVRNELLPRRTRSSEST
jgi:Uma2 family endonuclease